MSLSILVIIALAVLLIAGYSQKIEGEAFVVTKGRDTIKLSLLEIFIIPTDKFEVPKDVIITEM